MILIVPISLLIFCLANFCVFELLQIHMVREGGKWEMVEPRIAVNLLTFNGFSLQDTLSNGGAVLPYKTVPSTVMHLYSPLTPCSEVEVAEPPPIAEKQPSPPNLSPTANGSIPSLCSMSHNSLGPRPVCRIKRCRIPDEEEMRISPLLVPSHGRPSCSGDGEINSFE